ncbi:hypothetical protein RRG08_058761 [Elysia crispata]|uniref:Uncharacterized protein n=1 Tax=Elysia crispata TaxID=231223 RepID=A0AAE1D5V9_9GAST|nr:hypothetical protein RRG08_058761 [Elysia crispata]
MNYRLMFGVVPQDFSDLIHKLPSPFSFYLSWLSARAPGRSQASPPPTPTARRAVSREQPTDRVPRQRDALVVDLSAQTNCASRRLDASTESGDAPTSRRKFLDVTLAADLWTI